MNPFLIEAAEVMGIGLASGIATGSLAFGILHRRACRAIATRVAKREADTVCQIFGLKFQARLARLEDDTHVHRAVLNQRGLMLGQRIVPDIDHDQAA